MLRSSRFLGAPARVLLSVLLPVLLLSAGQSIWSLAFSRPQLGMRLAFTLLFFLLAMWSLPSRVSRERYVWPGFFLICGLAVGGVAVWTLNHDSDVAAWAMALGAYVLLIGVDEVLTGVGLRWWRKLALRTSVAFLAGAVPVLLGQFESGFAEEEFFAVVQVVLLAAYWLSVRYLVDWCKPGSVAARVGDLVVSRMALVCAICLAAWAGLVSVVRSYQRSFYSSNVPSYSGISYAEPFLCGTTDSVAASVDGTAVFARLLDAVAQNPTKSAAEYGMLALGTEDLQWALEFREQLLAEARQGKFAAPANSVKYQQYRAAQRLYYFLAVQEKYPSLFSSADEALLADWFQSINRRAQTVEWVDGMYGLAFTKWPEGPYENQESGAALLSLLQMSDMSPSALRDVNADYLSRSQKGWESRFANTDDAFIYQAEWITNALFQSLADADSPKANVDHSFEWMLLQLLPDGVPLNYNHPNTVRLAGSLYLGALLTDDPRYVWLADQSLQALQMMQLYPLAQPGAETITDLVGSAPTQGSCLIYGDSGLPNQVGPLAPDKVVLRDGWEPDDTYLLQNLRFTGWHRYKASNAIPLIYWGRPVVEEVLSGDGFSWLPEGRSLFRDKRIPRDNLNAVTVERTGMSAVVYAMTGWGSQWAQDPPHYAEVIAFRTEDAVDMTHTRLTDWRSWTQDRWIYLFHDQGPIVVVDDARGAVGRDAQLNWQFPTSAVSADDGVILPDDEKPVAVRFVCLSDDMGCVVEHLRYESHVQTSVVAEGSLKVVSVFLFGDWIDSEPKMDPLGNQLTIPGPDRDIVLSLWQD